MTPCHCAEIKTPKGVILNGLWFGPKKPKRVIVWVHGLGSSAFSKMQIAEKIIDQDTAVMTFNNRGHDFISRLVKGKKRGYGGAACEIFTECVDDIQGAIHAAKKSGAKDIYLAGHSTGCQKSIYWAAKKGKGVRGVILLAPISDHAAETHLVGTSRVARALKIAQAMVRSGHPGELLTQKMWHEPVSAQRFISLYAGAGAEEIFTYWRKDQHPKTLESVRQPILAILAEKDEFSDRPASKMQDWFAEHLKPGDEIVIVKGANHGFKGAEARVAKGIQKWILEHKSV